MSHTTKWLIRYRIKMQPAETYVQASGDPSKPKSTSDSKLALAFDTRDDARDWMKNNAILGSPWHEEEHAFWDGEFPQPKIPFSRV